MSEDAEYLRFLRDPPDYLTNDLIKRIFASLRGSLKVLRDGSVTVPKELGSILTQNVPMLADDIRAVVGALVDNANPEILSNLHRMTSTVFCLGVMNGIGNREGRVRQERDRILERGRAVSRGRSLTRQAIIERHAGPVLQKHPGYSSNRVAAQIYEKVKADLDVVELPPLGTDAIRKWVQKYRRAGQPSGQIWKTGQASGE